MIELPDQPVIETVTSTENNSRLNFADIQVSKDLNKPLGPNLIIYGITGTIVSWLLLTGLNHINIHDLSVILIMFLLIGIINLGLIICIGGIILSVIQSTQGKDNSLRSQKILVAGLAFLFIYLLLVILYPDSLAFPHFFFLRLLGVPIHWDKYY